jgi:glycerophosphoryl diester phosphodiesterase
MRYSFKTIFAFAVLAGICGLLFLGIGVVMYGRTGGKELAERLGVPRPAIIAHRGASYLAPEETGPAFLLDGSLSRSAVNHTFLSLYRRDK